MLVNPTITPKKAPKTQKITLMGKEKSQRASDTHRKTVFHSRRVTLLLLLRRTTSILKKALSIMAVVVCPWSQNGHPSVHVQKLMRNVKLPHLLGLELSEKNSERRVLM